MLGSILLTAAVSCAPSRCEQERPNIIWIMTDQHCANALSCAGNANVKTPNIDRLAEHGVRFTNAYCAMPLSGPSRASMITGLMPCQSGVLENEKPLPEQLQRTTLGDVVRGAGYDCAYAGKWHVNTISLPSENAFGFDRIALNGDAGVAPACVEYLQQKHDKPFFMVASFINPHNICEFARGQRTPHADIPVPLSLDECPELPVNYAVQPDEPKILRHEKSLNYSLYPTVDYEDNDWRYYLYAYYRLVEAVDAQIGRIVDEIDRQNLWKNTVIVFMSDHGDGAAAHQWNQKTALYEEVANVPFIVCLPGGKKAGSQSDALVHAGIDIMPTFAAVAGVAVPEGRKGRNILKSNLSGPAQSPEYIVTETNFKQTSGAYGFMVRTADYKYVIYDKGKYREQLFDMRSDRVEMHNLAADPAYAAELTRHRAILWNWVNAHELAESACIKKFLMLP